MRIDKQKEDDFYKKEFNFSYSSLNKLLFSPSLFYKDYILNEREVKTDKHLVEGKLIHCLVFEPENLENKFNVLPGKLPSDSVKKVLKDMSFHTDAEKLDDVEDFVILDSLKQMNLYQSLKKDEARIDKIKVDSYQTYWEYLSNTDKDPIDQDTLIKCKDQAEMIKDNKYVMSLFNEVSTDFDLDPIETHAEKYLSSKIEGKPFGLHGYIDYYKINHDAKEVSIYDLKTTGKAVTDFKETVDFYNYWLQASIYCKLVYDSLGDKADEYDIKFNFIVIDKYNQIYTFPVSDTSLSKWAEGLEYVISVAKHHYTENNYSLPYELLTNVVTL
jgi:hypothetical protein